MLHLLVDSTGSAEANQKRSFHLPLHSPFTIFA